MYKDIFSIDLDIKKYNKNRIPNGSMRQKDKYLSKKYYSPYYSFCLVLFEVSYTHYYF